MAKKDNKDAFVGIAGAIGGISLVIVMFFLLFSPSQAGYSVLVVSALALMGIFLGYFASKK